MKKFMSSKAEVSNGTLVHVKLISTSKPGGYFNC